MYSLQIVHEVFNSLTIETGTSDFHKMVITVMNFL